MRIGTWNLQGRWDARHLELIEAMDCDVLLLTEVSERLDMPGYDLHLGRTLMASKRPWAAVASRLPARLSSAWSFTRLLGKSSDPYGCRPRGQDLHSGVEGL